MHIRWVCVPSGKYIKVNKAGWGWVARLFYSSHGISLRRPSFSEADVGTPGKTWERVLQIEGIAHANTRGCIAEGCLAR